MAKLVLASHGALAQGMADSLKMIVGEGASRLEVYCLHPGENPDDYAKAKKQEIEASEETHIFVADIQGGSVHTALMQLTSIHNVFVISGMNMPLVMELMFAVHDDIQEADIMKIVEGARAGIDCKRLQCSCSDEDF